MERAELTVASVAYEPRCTGCGYNLHGQRATWDAGTRQWSAICPECGATNLVRVDDGRPMPPRAYAVLGATLIGVYIAWQLFGGIAAGEVRLVWAFQTFFAEPTSPNSGGGLDAWLLTVAVLIVTHGLSIALTAGGLGALVSLAPYSNASQRLRLAIGVAAIACMIGLNEATAALPIEPSPGRSSPPQLTMLNGWAHAGSLIGLLIALGGVRLGLHFGRPAARMIAEMFLPPEWRPVASPAEARR